MLIGYETITCCVSTCGISFAVPSRWHEARCKDHSFFTCPNGHKQHFASATEEEKLRRERDILKQRIAQKDDEISHQQDLRVGVEKRLAATKGVVTRIKNRVGRGVCPCCNRTFSNLARHMAGEHPAYQAEDAA